MQELLDLFQGNQRQLEKPVFMCCFISIFAKTVEMLLLLRSHYRNYGEHKGLAVLCCGHTTEIMVNIKVSST